MPKYKKYIENRIMIAKKPFNRRQIYCLRDISALSDGSRLVDSKNNMKPSRPCIVVQEGKPGAFYGKTKLIVLPITSVKYAKDEQGKYIRNNEGLLIEIENDTIKFNENFVTYVELGRLSKCLIFNYAIRVESELDKWYNHITGDEVFISEKKLDEIIRILETYLMGSLKMTMEALDMKTAYEMIEENVIASEQRSKALEDTNKKIMENFITSEQRSKALEDTNKKIMENFIASEQRSKALEESNKNLELTIKELIDKLNKSF